MTSEQIWAVVPAAGTGSRMQADRPKQYLPLSGKRVIEHTLERLATHGSVQGIVVAVAENDRWWPQVILPDQADIYTVIGGSQRADSVLNACLKLATLTEDDPWVLVHDAARPCLRHADIDKMLQMRCEHNTGGVLGVPLHDTIKRTRASDLVTGTVSREGLWRAFTPQMFRLHTLIQALKLAKDKALPVTDEASAVELAGGQVKMVEGHADNIKVTHPADLALASLYLQQQRAGDES